MKKVYILLTLIFLAGLCFFIISNMYPKVLEGFSSQHRCPNLLVQKDAKLYLYTTNLAEVPGVNPIVFNNLEEYTEFIEWQRSAGIRCPVLYLQNTYDAQGNRVYKIRPSVSEPQGGLPPSSSGSTNGTLDEIQSPSFQYAPDDAMSPKSYLHPVETKLVDANHNDPPYNQNSYPSYDQTSYYVGTVTPLDAMNEAQEKLDKSPDPMDPNWGGAEFTQQLIDQGVYKGNEVSLYIT
jgi:hypothetical protein